MNQPWKHPRELLAGLLFAAILTSCSLPAPEPPPTTPTTFAFPTETSQPSRGSITGRVWHDECVPGREGEAAPTAAPEGCVAAAGGGYVANGLIEAAEEGISGVSVRLGRGACPSSGFGTTLTSAQGDYRFAGVEAGTYCVSVHAGAAENQQILLPGGWTHPEGDPNNTIAQQSVTVNPGEGVAEVDFGWDYQFLPEPGLATGTPSSAGTLTPTVEATATATITATAGASPTQISGDPRSGLGQPAFRDTFDGGANWPLYTDEHASFEVEGGRMQMTAFNPDFWDAWIMTHPVVEDFYLEATGELGTCSGRDHFGLIARATESDKGWVGYLFTVTCDGRYALRSWDGEAFTQIIPLTASEFVARGGGDAQRLGMWAEGDTIRLYVDGRKLADIRDGTHASGIFGVFIGAAATPNLKASMDEIAYWRLP